MVRYQYVPLNEEAKEMRLLTILPGSFAAEVRASLHIVPLTEQEPPVFEALSYA